MGLQYAVITMVTRDDLRDGGGHHVIETVHAVNSLVPEILIEVLVSDMSGDWDSLARLMEASPCVFAHNIETCGELYPQVRPEAVYSRSLEMIQRASQLAPDVITKSGFMVGLGETRKEISQLLADLRQAGTRILTVGQYLAPTPVHHPVFKYYSPDEFLDIEAEALSLGFSGVAAGPWIRSSYRARNLYQRVTSTLQED
jgi:lipoic acid synthetase